MNIIETNILVLREFCFSDSQNLLDLDSDPEVIKHTRDLPFSSIVDAESFLNSYSNYKMNGVKAIRQSLQKQL